MGPSLDPRQVWLLRLCSATSFLCVLVGFPCASFWRDVAFRTTGLAHTILGVTLSVQTSWARTLRLRILLLLHTSASFQISGQWCADFDSWALALLMSLGYQTIACFLLIKSHALVHLLLLVIGSALCYATRPDAGASVSLMEGREWAVMMAGLGVIMVSAQWLFCGDYLLKKLTAMVSVLTMTGEQLDNSLHLSDSSLSGSSRLSSSQLDLPENLPEGLEIMKYVSAGSYGRVYYCTWSGRRVAAKVMAWRAKHSRADPVQEAKLCIKLSHEKLIQTYHFYHGPKEVWLLQEWCDKGTLRDFCDRPRWDCSGLKYVKSMMSDVSEGCAYLHSQHVIHGDLSSNNVLLQSRSVQQEGDIEFVCKVCDFGLARVLKDGVSTLLTSQLGTVSHMPPELLVPECADQAPRLSAKADVYAIGVLLHQAVLGQLPYAGMLLPQIIFFLAEGRSLQLPTEVPEELRRLSGLCLKHSPENRPSSASLYQSFTSLSW